MNPIVPTVGRIVLFRHQRRNGEQFIRPAIITHVWSENCINLFVFPGDSSEVEATGVVTSVLYDDTESISRTWYWMPYQIATAAAAQQAETARIER